MNTDILHYIHIKTVEWHAQTAFAEILQYITVLCVANIEKQLITTVDKTIFKRPQGGKKYPVIYTR